jgi:plastocyanin
MKRLLLISALIFPLGALAAEPDYSLTIKDHLFQPAQFSIPAGKKVKLIIRNQDNLPVEFESSDLSREVIVPGHGEVTIYLGPIDSGTYQFFNDFNHAMQGSVVVNNVAGKGN